jgi:hypothetical protein
VVRSPIEVYVPTHPLLVQRRDDFPLDAANIPAVARESLRSYTSRMAKWSRETEAVRGQFARFKGDAAEHLVTYFRETCKLNAPEARVRAAKIGNARWGWHLQIGTSDLNVEDCPALRMLLGRRGHKSRSRRTPRKNRP